jgi:uncharacterized coiled-coil DUF342 family protein
MSCRGRNPAARTALVEGFSQPEGILDIFTLLMEDHRSILELFSRLEALEEDTDGQRDELFEMLKSELTLHKEAEERSFYAALSNLPELADSVEEALEEHVDIEELLNEMSGLETDDESFLGQITELRDEVQNHFAFEEGEIFSEARKSLTEDQANRLGQEMQAAKAEFLT